VKRLTIFITGTDTGVGKTVFACLLARHLRMKGFSVAALKPVCSGRRGDAKALHAALDGALTVDEVNPWHFYAPIAPLLAARLEKRKVKLAGVVAHARRIQKRFPILIVEGAGGLLSPLGEDFDSLGLIKTLRAVPVVIAPNRLGAINQVLLTLAALPRGISQKALVVMTQRNARPVRRGNLKFLAARLGRARIHELPWIRLPRNFSRAQSSQRLWRALDSVAGALGM
jgi:dethiobiotin synthetase